MTIFENIESIFQTIRDNGWASRDIVTLATTIGSITIFVYFCTFVYQLIQGLRLYILSQICCKTNYVKKYGQWAVISGSTDGIGLAMARELARRGMSIIVIGRNEEKLENTKASLENEPNVGEILTIKIDLSDSSLSNFDNIRPLIDPDNRDIGILINNAGTFTSTFQRFNRFDMSSNLEIVNLNILATVHLTRMMMPGMIARSRGLVVNVSSAVGQLPVPYFGLYGPTKSFMNTFSRQLQIEYADHPIEIVNLIPGAIHTKLFTRTSSLTKPTLVNPTPEDYARTAINALSTGINSYSGTMTHGITLHIIEFFNFLGLIPILAKLNLRLNAKDYQLSPVPKRKRTPNNEEPHATSE